MRSKSEGTMKSEASYILYKATEIHLCRRLEHLFYVLIAYGFPNSTDLLAMQSWGQITSSL